MHVDRKKIHLLEEKRRISEKERKSSIEFVSQSRIRTIRSRIETESRENCEIDSRRCFTEPWRGRKEGRKEGRKILGTTSTLVKRLWNRWTWSTFPSIAKTRPKTRTSPKSRVGSREIPLNGRNFSPFSHRFTNLKLVTRNYLSLLPPQIR